MRRTLAALLALGGTVVTACSTEVASTAPTNPSAAPTRAGADPGDATTSPPTTNTVGTTTAAAIASTTVATSTTATTSTVTTVAPWPRTLTMAFTGDTLPHSPLWRRAEANAGEPGRYDFRPMLDGLRPLLEPVDLAVCHLETPIAPADEEFSTSPFYGVPPEIADAIASAGYDRCSTASNHAADRGTAGVDRTVAVLESRGVDQSGMARRPAEIEPSVFDVDGVAVSHLSYTFSYNGLSFPTDEQWRSAVIDPGRIVTDARIARLRGATVVIVSLHWGAEGRSAVTSSQRSIADEITAAGVIDLVVGHHAHVVQPVEQVNGTWVLFGLGNILSNLPTSDRWPDASQDAVVALVDVEVDRRGAVTVGRPELAATWVDKEAGWIVRDVDAELARSDIGAGQRGRLQRSRERTAAVVGEHMAPRIDDEPLDL